MAATTKQEVKAEPRQPEFVCRARQHPDSEFWVTIGAAWSYKNGEPGYSVKLHTVPTNWDGSFLMMPPLEKEAD